MSENTFEIASLNRIDPYNFYVVKITRKHYRGESYCYIYFNKNIKIRLLDTTIHDKKKYNNYYIDLSYSTVRGFDETCKYVEGYNRLNWTSFGFKNKITQKDIDLLNFTVFKDFVNIFKLKDDENVSLDLDNLTKSQQNIYIKRLFNQINNNNNKFSLLDPNIADSITNAINRDYDLLQEKKINDANEKYKKQLSITFYLFIFCIFISLLSLGFNITFKYKLNKKNNFYKILFYISSIYIFLILSFSSFYLIDNYNIKKNKSFINFIDKDYIKKIFMFFYLSIIFSSSTVALTFVNFIILFLSDNKKEILYGGSKRHKN